MLRRQIFVQHGSQTKAQKSPRLLPRRPKNLPRIDEFRCWKPPPRPTRTHPPPKKCAHWWSRSCLFWSKITLDQLPGSLERATKHELVFCCPWHSQKCQTCGRFFGRQKAILSSNNDLSPWNKLFDGGMGRPGPAFPPSSGHLVVHIGRYSE